MPPVPMRPGSARYLITEAQGMYRSRGQADVVPSTTVILLSGTILGRLVTGAAVSVAKTLPAANTGNATVGAVVPLSNAVPGVFRVRFLTATTFTVARPSGALLANGATGVAYTGEIGFTITVGATPMVAGDGFDITVTSAPGDFARHDLGASNGAQTVAGILFEEVATGTIAVRRTISMRDCEVNGAHLVYSAGANAAQIATANAALLALGIVVRP